MNRQYRKVPGLLLAVGLLMSVVSLPLQGQSPLSKFVGTVRDSSGAVVIDAEVTAADERRGYSRTVLTDSAGNYQIDLLLEGSYQITCELQGFKKFVRTQIPLPSKTTMRIDMQLEVGELTSQVTVTEAAPVVASETAEVQANTLSRQMMDVTMARGLSGFVHTPYLGPSQSAVFVIRGASSSGAGAYGATTGARMEGMDLLIQQTPLAPDFIQEVKLSYSGNKADQSSAALIESPTRSGTNQVHAKVDVNLLNPALNALGTNPFAKRGGGQVTTRSTYVQGAGPVYIPKVYDGRNRTFWWVGFQSAKALNPPRGRPGRFIPPTAWRTGDFSQAPANIFANAQQQLIDPVTGQPFLDNKIPENRIAPHARPFNALFAQPNFGGGIADPAHFVGNNYQVITLPGGQFSSSNPRLQNIRADHELTSRDQIGYTLARNQNVGGWNYDEMGIWVIDQFGNNDWHTGYWTHTFSPAVLNDFRFGRSHSTDGWGIPRGENSLGMQTVFDQGGFAALEQLNIDWKPDISPDSRPGNGLPVICIGGLWSPMCGTGGNESEGDIDRNITSVVDNMTVIRGRHSLKFGAEVVKKQFKQQISTAFGRFNYDGRFTGLPYGDFLLGLPGEALLEAPAPLFDGRTYRHAFYIMDDWRVRSDLTLELGLRHEYHGTPFENNFLMVNFDPATGSLVVPNDQALAQVSPNFDTAVNPVVTAAEVGFPERLVRRPQPMLYPRIGLAWRPFNDAKTVVRAGVGQFGAPLGATHTLRSSTPYVLNIAFSNAFNENTPLFTQNNPIPSITGPGGPAPGTSARGINVNYPLVYTQNWNLTVEREIGANMGVRMAYLGSKGTQLPYRVDLTKPPAGLLPYRQNCASLAPGSCVGPAYTNYSGVTFAEAGGNQSHHGLELEFHRRWTDGLEFMVDYYWSKTMTDVQDSTNPHPTGNFGNLIENNLDRSRDRAIGRHTIPHRLVVNHVWQLPFGRGMKFLNQNRAFDAVLGGWTFLGLWQWNSRPYAIPLWRGADPSNTNTFVLRPDLLPNCEPNLDNPTVAKTFNRDCYALPGQGGFGNAGNYSLRLIQEPVWQNSTLGIFKTFKLADVISEQGLRFRLGAEFINAINHPYRSGAFASIFGEARAVNEPGSDESTMIGSRRIRFNLRLEF